MEKEIRKEFEEKGFVHIKGVLTKKEVAQYLKTLRKIVSSREKLTMPDGVTKNKELWPLIFHKNLLHNVKKTIGKEAKFLQHNDLHYNFTASGFHRDNVNRVFNKGGDWKPNYKIARVALYLTNPKNQFNLVFKESSNKKDSEDLKEVSICPKPGDLIIFDPRMIHKGKVPEGEKASIFLAYGIENQHFNRHWYYYRNLRPDLHYGKIPEELKEKLRKQSLLSKNLPRKLKIKHAYLPNKHRSVDVLKSYKERFSRFVLQKYGEIRLKSLIRGKRVLIIGSQKSALELKSIPKNVLVFGCNFTPSVLLDKEINKKVDLFYVGSGALQENLNIRALLKKVRFRFFMTNNLPLLKKEKITGAWDSVLFNDHETNKKYIKSLTHPVPFEKIRNNAVHDFTSSGVWLMQLALYFKASEIYLIGMDFQNKNHFHKDPEGFVMGYAKHEPIDHGFLNEIMKKKNIFSASKKSPVVSRFPYKELK